jgi:hypothetical protein
LSQFDISYMPRTTIKSQALVDFMADWTPSVVHQREKSTMMWTVYTDGA